MSKMVVMHAMYAMLGQEPSGSLCTASGRTANQHGPMHLFGSLVTPSASPMELSMTSISLRITLLPHCLCFAELPVVCLSLACCSKSASVAACALGSALRATNNIFDTEGTFGKTGEPCSLGRRVAFDAGLQFLQFWLACPAHAEYVLTKCTSACLFSKSFWGRCSQDCLALMHASEVCAMVLHECLLSVPVGLIQLLQLVSAP